MTVLRTYTVQLKLNNIQQRKIDSWFYEGKCFYNFCLAQEDIFKINACSVKNVNKFDKNKNLINVNLENIPSKVKQNIHRRICDSIKALSASKNKGKNIGRLKFKSELPSLYFDNQSVNIINGEIRLLGFGRQTIKCFGIEQFKPTDIIKCATLKRFNNKYMLNISVARIKPDRQSTNKQVGLDFGIKDTVITSEGDKFKCILPETKKLKKLQRKLARSISINGKTKTNNQRKTRIKLQKEYQHIVNQKKDFTNKLCSYLDKNFDIIAFQDEQIKGWKNIASTTVQHSCLGSIKPKLISKVSEEPDRYMMIDKFKPTTKLCPNCKTKNELSLNNRVYYCSCGYSQDRDIHAANNVLGFALGLL